jgi:flagellar hook-associated protein 1 FlgK
MTSLFDVGKSAIQAYRQSLGVTGQNIANINTEGYKRREANLEEVTPVRAASPALRIRLALVCVLPDITRSFDCVSDR